MKKLLIPLILLIVGVGGGVGAGLFLSPPPEPELAQSDNPCGDVPHVTEQVEHAAAEPSPDPTEEVEGREYARLNNQFVVPVVVDSVVDALVVLSLSIEVPAGGKEAVFAHEPKLRDHFLQVFFEHANQGGFSGAFTSTTNMRILREALRDAAFEIMGDRIVDVLIIDIVRQDV